MKLGELFPEALREEVARRQIVPGSVIHVYCDFTTPPKNKFLVVASTSPFLVFLINSEINQFIRSRRHLLDCQVRVDRREHPFLKHDSWADCVDARDVLDLTNVVAAAVEDTTGVVKGLLSANCIREILQCTKRSKSLAPRWKRLITDALEVTLADYDKHLRS